MSDFTKKAGPSRRKTLKNRYFCKILRDESSASASASASAELEREEYETEPIRYHDPDYEFPKGVTRTGQKSPALELFLATDKAYDIQEPGVIQKVMNEFNKATHNSWFKFVLITVNDEPKLYIIYGNDEQNKHSVCYLYGMYENLPRPTTPSASDKPGSDDSSARPHMFHELMDAILSAKGRESYISESDERIVALNAEIYRNFKCMDVIVSGSATYMGQQEDGKHLLCINTKSGHYLPDLPSLQDAVITFFPHLFPEDWTFVVRKNEDIGKLEKLYGEHFSHYSGTCLSNEEKEMLEQLKQTKSRSKSNKNKTAVGGKKRRKHKRITRRRFS
jgi:hypothetical protein